MSMRALRAGWQESLRFDVQRLAMPVPVVELRLHPRRPRVPLFGRVRRTHVVDRRSWQKRGDVVKLVGIASLRPSLHTPGVVIRSRGGEHLDPTRGRRLVLVCGVPRLLKRE